MLIASKNGSITAAKLISETDAAWTLEVEKRKRRLSKTDSRQRAFNDMSEAMKWAGAEPELIEHFAASLRVWLAVLHAKLLPRQ